MLARKLIITRKLITLLFFFTISFIGTSVFAHNCIVIQGNTQITLSAGQSYNFKIQESVPTGTPYYRWSCIEVQAKSDECNSISANTLLKVYVPDPTEE